MAFQPIGPADALITHQPAVALGEAFGQPQVVGFARLQLALLQGEQLACGAAVAQGDQVQVGLFACQAGDQVAAFQLFIGVKQAEVTGQARQLQAQVVDQLQRGSWQVHVGQRSLQQGQAVAKNRMGRADLRLQAKVQHVFVVQAVGVGRWQPGLGEASAEPAGFAFHQALLGDLLQCGEQRQVQLVGRYVTRNQLEYGVAAVFALLAHHHPVILALQLQGQAHRHAEVGQLHGKVLAVGNL